MKPAGNNQERTAATFEGLDILERTRGKIAVLMQSVVEEPKTVNKEFFYGAHLLLSEIRRDMEKAEELIGGKEEVLTTKSFKR
jgi:hypothetical protein